MFASLLDLLSTEQPRFHGRAFAGLGEAVTSVSMAAVREQHVMGHDVHTCAFESTHKLGQTIRCLVVAKQTSLIPFGQFSLGHSTAHLASELAREFT